MNTKFEYMKSIKDADYIEYCGGLYQACCLAGAMAEKAPDASLTQSRKAGECITRLFYAKRVDKNLDKKKFIEMLQDQNFQEEMKKVYGAYEADEILRDLHKIRKVGNEAAHSQSEDSVAAAKGNFSKVEKRIPQLLSGLGIDISESEEEKKSMENAAQDEKKDLAEKVEPVMEETKPAENIDKEIKIPEEPAAEPEIAAEAEEKIPAIKEGKSKQESAPKEKTPVKKEIKLEPKLKEKVEEKAEGAEPKQFKLEPKPKEKSLEKKKKNASINKELEQIHRQDFVEAENRQHILSSIWEQREAMQDKALHDGSRLMTKKEIANLLDPLMEEEREKARRNEDAELLTKDDIAEILAKYGVKDD